VRKILLTLILFVILASVFVVRLNFLFSRKYSAGTRVRITERLTEQPYLTRSSQVFRLSGFRVVTYKFPPYSYGDVLVVEGELKGRDSSRNTGLLSGLQRDFTLVYPDILIVRESGLVGVLQESLLLRIGAGLTGLRGRLVDLYRKVLPEPHASLLSGVVLGVRAQMPASFYTALQETGTLHVIAASGMNVTIVAGVLIAVLVRLFTRRNAIIFAIIGIIFYTFLAGASAPVVRAAIAGVVAYLGALMGRERDGVIVLVFVAVVMLMWNPLYILDIGWQLSFAATAGILLVFPVLQRYIKIYFDRFPLALGDELGITLAAQLATLPLIVYHFGSLSWISPVVNVLVAPVVPVLMAWGGLIAGVGFVSEGLARVVSWGAWVFLEYFVKVVEAFGKWFDLIEVGKVSILWVMGFYLVLSWGIWRLRMRSDNT